MGNSPGDIPEEYLATEQTQEKQATPKRALITKDVPSQNTLSPLVSEDIALPDIRSISPASFFELKREFLKLSESYIARFITKLDTMRDAYENDDSERKARDLFESKKLGNTISYEQYLYYSSILKPTNLIYRERIASAVFASKDTLDLFYFQVHFAYNLLRKSKKIAVPSEVEAVEWAVPEKNTPYAKVTKVIENLRESAEYKNLSDIDRKALDATLTKKILFGLRVHNPEAFNNGLQSILASYFRTKNEIFLDCYEKIKQSFWILKNDFVDFLGENRAFLLWIHIMLDAAKLSGERSNKEKEVFMEYIKNLSLAKSERATNLEQIKRSIRSLLQDRQMPASFCLDDTDSPYQIFSYFGAKDEPLMKNMIQYIQTGAFFLKCQDLLFKRNDFLFDSKTTEGVYFNDLQKYFQRGVKNEGPTINDIIIQLSKHTLYFYLYPIFLYSIAKKVQLSQNDFRILQDSGILMSANVEDFLIVSNFYADLNELINKEKNLGLTKLSPRSIFFHMKQWTFPILSAGVLSLAFSFFFHFPLYFALLWVVYTVLYIMSEYLLSYRLRLPRVLVGYAMIGLFFLLGGFNINYQQVTTERLTQAHNFLDSGSGTFDVEKAMVEMNSTLNPDSMKANVGESGSGKVKK